MVKISGVIITYNEEGNISDCLDSLVPVVDEIVVVDSYSTDRTKEICLEKGANVYQNEFLGHIEQKNFAITKASFPHVLSLDADERLSPELSKSILAVKDNWQADAYFLNRLNNFCGKWIKHSAWYPDKKLRLWDSRKGIWGGVNPHDKFIMKKGSTLSRLDGDLLHYSFKSIEEHKKQIQLFSGIKAQKAFDKGEKFALVKLIIKPVFKFVRNYILKLGFLDGYYGFVICANSSWAEFLRYYKLIKLNRNSSVNNISDG